MEQEFHYDAADPFSIKETGLMITEERDTNREQKDGFEVQDIALCAGDDRLSLQERMNELGPLYCNYHLWQERIKRALDPNDVVDRSTYGIGIAGRDINV